MKMFISTNVFPSWFALKLSEKVNLKPYENELDNEYALRQFQVMSVNSDFENCMINYINVDKPLKKNQEAALKQIHELTKDWILGHITEELANKLATKSITGADAAKIGTVLRDLTAGELTEDGKGDGKLKGNNFGMRVVLTTDDKK